MAAAWICVQRSKLASVACVVAGLPTPCRLLQQGDLPGTLRAGLHPAGGCGGGRCESELACLERG